MREFKGLRRKVFDEDDMGEEAGGEEEASSSSKSAPLPICGTSEKKLDEVTMLPSDPKPRVRIAGEISLKEIKGVLKKSLEKIRRIKSIVEKKTENEQYVHELLAFYMSLMASRNQELMDREWLEWKLMYLGNVCRKTELDCLPNVIKEALRDIYPNVPIFPTPQKQMVGDKSIPKEKRGMEDTCKFAEIDEELVKEKKKYIITLKMIMHDGEQKRFMLCPFPGCGKSFRSNRMADACLNKHLNILYSCIKCKFVMHNLNLFCNHICFAYSSGCKRMKRHESPDKPKMGGVKKAKMEPVEEDLIIIDDK